MVAPTSEGAKQELDGEPGAAPGNAVVRVTNLDGTDQAYATTAFADGHFSITLPVKFYVSQSTAGLHVDLEHRLP
jgi:hypothetical protein